MQLLLLLLFVSLLLVLARFGVAVAVVLLALACSERQVASSSCSRHTNAHDMPVNLGLSTTQTVLVPGAEWVVGGM